jgi:nucleolar GTP-binding protein
LEDSAWKYDIVPEIMDGKNIADFVDADILEKLKALEKEEEMLEGLEIESEDEEIDEDFLKANREIKNKKAILKLKHKVDKFKIRPKNVKLEKIKEALQ